MLLSEEKLINGIKYFAKNTNNLGRTKLFKLLFFWDFTNLKKTGKLVTGYTYLTYPFGPVPEELYNQIKNDTLAEPIHRNIAFLEDDSDEFSEYKMFKIKAKNSSFDKNVFTKQELKTLEEIAFIYKEVTGNEISEISHLKGTPWKETITKKGMWKKIDFNLAFDSESEYDQIEAEEYLKLQQELKTDGFI